MIRDIHQIDVVAIGGFREPFSSLSHLIGAAIFAGLSYDLIRRGKGDWIRTASLAIFAASAVLLLLLSGIYHVFWPGPTRELMLRFDVACVFLLIAGSMTPVHAILFRGYGRWGALTLIWTVAISGIIWRILFCENSPGPAGITFFLFLGWGGLITAFVLWRRFGWAFIRPTVISGMVYTLGAIGLILHEPVLVRGVIEPHEVWHLAVLCGLGYHWRFVTQFAGNSTDPGRVDELLSR